MWEQLAQGISGRDSGGGGSTYGNSGSSGVSTPVTTTTGGLGGQTFDLSNRAFSTSGIPTWAIVAGLALLAFWVLRK